MFKFTFTKQAQNRFSPQIVTAESDCEGGKVQGYEEGFGVQCAQGADQGSALTTVSALRERGKQELCGECLPFSLVSEYSLS